MNQLKLAEHIINLRRKRGVTQEELAQFLGVTKASVSKWETKQSMPDILLLPAIASYFDVSIDELMGYQAQLTKEEIQAVYHGFARQFEEKPFEEVMEESREFVKKYYACYPALLQMVLLWLNHAVMPEAEQTKKQILNEAVSLCLHIEAHCADVAVCNDAVMLKAMAKLFLGEAQEVIRLLEPLHDPKRLAGQNETMLVQAYQMAGERAKAEAFGQYVMYHHVLALLTDGILYFMAHFSDRAIAEETLQRLENVIEAYQIKTLHPNTYYQFVYACAQFYCIQGEEEMALQQLDRFVKGVAEFVSHGTALHGDNYFTQLDYYFTQFDLGTAPPRADGTVLNSLGQALDHPCFAVLSGKLEFERLKQMTAVGNHRKGIRI